MAILYSLNFSNSNSEIDNFPPQILESDWYKNWQSRSFAGATKGTRLAYFKTTEEFETWFNANRLTDSTLISAFNEWKSTHNITTTENFHELPDYSPTVSGIFG
jgi:hypothetical protein